MSDSNSMDPTRFREWNEEMASRFDPQMFIEESGFLVRHFARRRIQIILDWVNEEKNSRVVEVGCGPGLILWGMGPARRFGLELSSVMLDRARSNQGQNPGWLIQGDASQAPVKDGSMDCVICSEVFEHVIEPKLVFDELVRITRPGGRIIVSIPNERLIDLTKAAIFSLRLNKLIFGRYQADRRMTDNWHLHSLNLRSFLQLLDDSVQLLQVRRVPYWFSPFGYVLKLERRT